MNIAIRHLLLGTTALIAIGCGSSDSDATAGELALQKAGSNLDGSGLCATVMQINSACPPDLAWDNHGQYVSCVTHYLKARLAAGDIDEEQIGELVSLAAHSLIGKKKGGHDQFAGFGDCDAPDGGVGGADGVGGRGHDGDDHDGDDDDDHSCGGVDGGDDGGHDDGGHDGDDDDDDDDDDNYGGEGGRGGSDQNEGGADSGWGWGGHP